MIRVVRTHTPRGECHFSAFRTALDALNRVVRYLGSGRALKSLGVGTDAQIGLFREGRETPDLITTVGIGAWKPERA